MSKRYLVRQRCGPLLACVVLTLGGCASLPSSGPTAHDIVASETAKNRDFDFKIVNLDQTAAAELSHAESTLEASKQTLATLAADHRADLIGPGDVLTVSIYEVGVSLFAGSGPRGGGTAGFDPSAHSENFPAIAVGAQGDISLPYLGRLIVGGLTTDEARARIEQGLRGKSQEPKALVSIRENVANTVYMSGDVHKPGRLELTLGHERLLDAIASSGGAISSPEDTLVRVSRGDKSIEQRLGTIRSGSQDDLTLNPGDRIELLKHPRTYLVFGATTHVSEIPFERSGVTLAEAIARVGGPSDATADPSAIFLFRYVADRLATSGEQPVIYRLNMLNPGSYFLAQRIAMRDKDVIYIANARANRPAKLMNIVNTLFAPFVSVRAAVQ